MTEKDGWDSFIELFKVLNEKCKYVIIRNYANLSNGKLLDNHDDIDILCDDTNLLVEVMHAEKKYKDNIHYKIKVNNVIVDVDIRTIGDGYFDKNWEIEILENRNLFNDSFYIMDKENEYYTILYHEIYQKQELREDYLKYLKSLAADLDIEFDERMLKMQLDSFMKKQNYEETGYRCGK